MKTQTLYGITFNYLNFKYTFGRNLLATMMQAWFSNITQNTYLVKEKEVIESFKQVYPNVTEIDVFMIGENLNGSHPSRTYLIKRMG